MGGGRVAMMVAPIILMVVATVVLQSVEATTYKVGDANGWKVQADLSFYSSWASGHTFHIYDILEFNFTSGKHTVAEVSQSDYENCVTTSPITTWTTGPATVTLNSTGSLYFICTISPHCSKGQKVTINVSSSTTPPSPNSASSLVAAAATSVAVSGLAYVVGLL